MIALHLNVAESGVTDAGLAHLAGFKGLQDRHRSGVGITDVGLAHLARLQGLRELYLDRTK
jgi:hypothetical protein